MVKNGNVSEVLIEFETPINTGSVSQVVLSL